MFGNELTAALIKTFGIAFGGTVPLQQVLNMFKQMNKGGTIFLPPGVYEINNTLHVQQPGIAIVGIGKHQAAIQLKNDISEPAIKISAQGCVLENLFIESNGKQAKGGILIEGVRCEVRSVAVSSFNKSAAITDLPYGIKVNSFYCSIFEPYIQHCERGIVISQHQNVIYGGSIISDNPNDDPRDPLGTPRFCGIEIGDKATPNNNTIIGTDIEIHSRQAHVYFSGGWANRFIGIRLEGKYDKNLVGGSGKNHFLISRASVGPSSASAGKTVEDSSGTSTFELADFDNSTGFNSAQAMRVVSDLTQANASKFPVGECVWHSKLNKPLWSDGKTWRDANGQGIAQSNV